MYVKSLLNKTKKHLGVVKNVLPGRWFYVLISLGLITTGLIYMHTRDPIGTVNPTLELLNLTMRLEIVNMHNFGIAIPYLLGAGLLGIFCLAANSTWGKIEASISPANQLLILNRIKIAAPFFAGPLFFAFVIIKLWKHEYMPGTPWLWIISLGLMSLPFLIHDNPKDENPRRRINRADIFWLAGLFLFGLGVGSFRLIDIPNIMIPDEGSFWETARSIARGFYNPVFFGYGVYTFPIASSIYQGWVMRLVGINIWGWRFASVLAGMITIIPLYLLAKIWTDRRVAVLSVLIMVCNPYFLSFARLGYNNSQALFPVVLSLYFWSLGYQRTKPSFYWLSGIIAGMGFYTYPAAWLGLVTILTVMTVLTLSPRLPFRRGILITTIILMGAIASAGPRLVYSISKPDVEPFVHKILETSFANSFYARVFYGPSELYPEGIAYLVGKNQMFYAPDVYIELLTRSTVRTFAALFNPSLVTEHFMITNFSGGFLAAMGLILGLSLSIKEIYQTRSILLLACLATGIFFLGIIAAFPPRHTHLVTIIPILALLSAIGFTISIETFANSFESWLGPSLVKWLRSGLLTLVACGLVMTGLRTYFVTMPIRNPPLFEDIVSWIAWRTKEPLSIIYIGENADDPHRVQYLIDTKMVPHACLPTVPADFSWKYVPSNSIVFLEQQDKSIPKPGPHFNNFATYTNANNEIIGFAWTNTDVNLNPSLPFQKDFR